MDNKAENLVIVAACQDDFMASEFYLSKNLAKSVVRSITKLRKSLWNI